MKKAIITISMTLFLVMVFSSTGSAGVDINIGVGLPPPVAFSGPPQLIVIPGTYVYVSPDVDEDIFFYHGYWWRPWGGHWYRSRDYSRGWSYYGNPPYDLRRIPPTWRDDYRNHHWRGKEWNYSPIPHQDVRKNWWRWEKDKHWDKREYRQTRPQSREFNRRDEQRYKQRDDQRGRKNEQKDERRGRGDEQRDGRRDDQRGEGR